MKTGGRYLPLELTAAKEMGASESAINNAVFYYVIDCYPILNQGRRNEEAIKNLPKFLELAERNLSEHEAGILLERALKVNDYSFWWEPLLGRTITKDEWARALGDCVQKGLVSRSVEMAKKMGRKLTKSEVKTLSDIAIKKGSFGSLAMINELR